MSHPLERKLRSQFCPYLVTARHLNRWAPYRIYTAYSYLGEVFVLLGGFGLANPVTKFLSGQEGEAGTKQAASAVTVVDFLSTERLALLSLVLLVAWGLVKFYVSKQALEERCNLIRSYRRQCLQIELGVRRALAEPDPMPELITLQVKLGDLVNRNIAESSIPGLGIDSRLQPEIDAHCDRLVDEFSENWTVRPEDKRRGGPGGGQ